MVPLEKAAQRDLECRGKSGMRCRKRHSGEKWAYAASSLRERVEDANGQFGSQAVHSWNAPSIGNYLHNLAPK